MIGPLLEHSHLFSAELMHSIILWAWSGIFMAASTDIKKRLENVVYTKEAIRVKPLNVALNQEIVTSDKPFMQVQGSKSYCGMCACPSMLCSDGWKNGLHCFLLTVMVPIEVNAQLGCVLKLAEWFIITYTDKICGKHTIGSVYMYEVCVLATSLHLVWVWSGVTI